MDSDAAVAWLAEDPPATALFSDFDGTLAEIVPRPELATPVEGVTATLGRLAERFALVGVVSGRPVAFLLEKLRLTPSPRIQVWGLHGTEHSSGGPVELAPGLDDWLPVVAHAVTLARQGGAEGLEIEDKQYGVTIHWRNAKDKAGAEQAAARIVEEIVAATGLGLRPGKASVEFFPTLGIDKGTAIREGAGGAGATRVVFFGDDVSDIAGFEAVDQLAAGGAAGLKVAVVSPEAPSALGDQADVVLATPGEAADLLRRVSERVG